MIGVLVNPVAGVGGTAGLSGSDGVDIQRLAEARGGRSRAHERMAQALRVVARKVPSARLVTVAGRMGEDAVREAALSPRVVFSPTYPTRACDTVAAVRAFIDEGVDLVLFAGGDGTARDVALSLPDGAAGLGVPSGVKMYSGVFGVSPQAAGATAAAWEGGHVPTAVRDVLDVDEETLRQKVVAPTVYSVMRVPVIAGRTQARKGSVPTGERDAVAAAAQGAFARVSAERTTAIGPGSTMRELARLIGYDKGPLGVDIVRDGVPLVRDASEADLLEVATGSPLSIVVSVIGGHGFVIGRGNQQISHRVLDAIPPTNLIVVASEQKLLDLQGRPLLIDSGDAATDDRLSGVVTVITGVRTTSRYRLRSATKGGARVA
ncbi:ATP-NAD kinase family protein [Xylanimonas ulmi]|uniref:Putative polyphosphate/ATP-dependent NAD kinase n=1 Tax=Xylanimonas ulmi TaxID=228973 RepID=A0A4V2EXK7_9MICO|nr:NAD(+)/NADH kinase [Xylanibacterium ulmi]RZS59830.1 putative polyphosphate/ATP-dependent NAD kinase [Xylanibacterium ulmi]